MKKALRVLSILLITCLFLTGCSNQGAKVPDGELKLTLFTADYQLKHGESVELDLAFTIDGEDGEWSLLTFKSANEAVVTINKNGVLKGVADGETTVSATIGDKSVTANVIVTNDDFSLTLSRNSLGLFLGETETITASAYKNEVEDTNAQIKWTSSNSEAITVENGTVTAVADGESVITAKYGTETVKVKVTVVSRLDAEQVNSFDEQYVNVYGRSYMSGEDIRLDHAANAVEVGIVGSKLIVNLTTSAKSYMRVWIDDVEQKERIPVLVSKKRYTVVSGLTDEYHKIRIVKATEMQSANWSLASLEADAFATVSEKSDFKIEFIGDSISAGYGTLGSPNEPYSVDNSDSTRTYAYSAANELNADYSVVAWSGICTKAYHWDKTLNMLKLYQQISKSNQTKYAFDFNPDVVVVNLGTNEASYLQPIYGGSTYAAIFPADYREFLTIIRNNNPDAFIICLYGMMGFDSSITDGIITAIEQMDDENIIFNPFDIRPNGLGSSGHPSEAAQMDWGKTLAKHIQRLGL